MKTRALITLFFAIIILVGAIYCKIRGKKQEDWKTNQTVDFIIFCALLFVGFAIRVWQFGMIPDGMNQDGAMAAVDAKALADHGTDRYGMYMPVHGLNWTDFLPLSNPLRKDYDLQLPQELQIPLPLHHSKRDSTTIQMQSTELPCPQLWRKHHLKHQTPLQKHLQMDSQLSFLPFPSRDIPSSVDPLSNLVSLLGEDVPTDEGNDIKRRLGKHRKCVLHK